MTMFGSQWLANAGSTYEIEQSIRFNDNDSAYLTRTPSSAGNQKTNTISCWVKRANLGTGESLAMFSAAGGSYGLTWYIDSSETDFSRERLSLSDGSSTLWQANDYRLRDPASWYHFVFAMDTTQATQSNRMKVYINGALVTADSNALVENTDYPFFDDVVNRIGSWSPSGGAAGRYMEGYMAEIHLIDGAQKAASDFGEYNDDGVWIPKAYSGAYGDQGAYLKGQDSSALGDDTSGNGNDFSSSGLAANDQMSDSPTNNWCIMNSLDAVGPTLSDGNLAFTDSNGSAWRTARATMAIPSTGKWYWECIAASSGGAGDPNFGIVADTVNTQVSDWYQDALAYAYSTRQDSVVNNDWTGTSRGTYAGGNVLQIAYDSGTGKLHFGIQNSWINGGDPADGSSPDFTTSTTLTFLPYVAIYNSKTGSINFGQSAFAYTPPTGFKALNTSNLDTPTITDGSAYFHTQLYTGNGSSGLAITNDANAGDFKPDLWYLAPRSNGDNHVVIDSVRGVTSRIYTNKGDAEDIDSPAQITFETDGFDLDTTDVNFNGSGRTYVAWQWKTTGGSSSTNETGDITSTVSANTTAGFSVLTYSGNGSDNQEIGHGIGIPPKMIITKRRNASGSNWSSYHDAVGINKVFYLNLRNAVASNTEQYRAVPTSSVYTVGVGGDVNASGGTYVSYCFAEVEGFSSIGSYTGNGNADGPFVYCGFEPAFLLIKSTGDNKWVIKDTKRSPFNAASLTLVANNNDAELTSDQPVDINSSGFKLRTTGSGVNASGVTYIYMAFAEHPFGGDGAAPATAR